MVEKIVIDGIKKKFWGICDNTDACNIPPRRKFQWFGFSYRKCML